MNGYSKLLNISYNFFYSRGLDYNNNYKSLLLSKPSLSNSLTSSPNYVNTNPVNFYKNTKKKYDTKILNLIKIYIKVNTFSFSKIIKIHPG